MATRSEEETATGPALEVRRSGAVVTLVLSRPDRLNAIDSGLARLLMAAVEEVAADPNCRCLVLTGRGRAFCAGQALGGDGGEEDLPHDLGALIRERYLPLILGLRSLPLPVLAAVNGPAVGSGFSLALAADLRVVAESAWFSCGFARLGLVPDSGASYFLPRLLGPGRAFQFLVTGERISASQALEMGLASSLYPDASFQEQAGALARELAAGPTLALALTKRALERSPENGLRDQLELEAELQQEAAASADFEEGLRAFREKRPPRFQGR